MHDTNAFYEEVGRRVRDARTRRKPALTQEELADRVGLTRTSITNLEKGRQKFLLHTLIDIAEALQVQPSSLLPDVGSDRQKQLEQALKNRPKAEKEWIKSAVSAVQKEKVSDGP
jgi:transcriptional regulator with XRE-family HTH domain